MRGERIPLVAPQNQESELPFTERLIVPVHLSGTGTRQILLQLNSGSDGLILYAGNEANSNHALFSTTLSECRGRLSMME
jgi:hypothetical protein